MAADNSKPWEDFSPVVKPSSSEQPDTKPWEDFGGETKPAPKGFMGHARDLGISALQGAIGVPEMAVGLADIPTGGAVGKALENEGGALGFRPKQAREYLDTLKTDGTQQQKREFEQADGVIGKTAYALQNPSLVANAVAESLPMMGAGGVIGRGIVAAAPKVGAGMAAAAGEGITAAGSAAEQIRQETADGTLTPTQAGLAAATGAATAGFGALGAKVAGRLGIADADTLMVQGAKGLTGEVAKQAAMKSIPRKVIEGAISEGFLEELPQSASEQILQNMALGKDWSEGVDSAVVLGVLSGMAMGGGAAGVQGVMQSPRQEAAPGQAPAEDPIAQPAQPEPAPSPGLEMMRQAYAEQLQALQGQEAGEPDVPQSTPPDGRAILDAQAAQAQAERDAAIAASRAVESPDDEILQSIGATAEPPHRAMGINPAAGPLSTGAAIAVDTGVAGQMQAAAQEVDDQAKNGPANTPEPAPAAGFSGSTSSSQTPVQALPGEQPPKAIDKVRSAVSGAVERAIRAGLPTDEGMALVEQAAQEQITRSTPDLVRQFAEAAAKDSAIMRRAGKGTPEQMDIAMSFAVPENTPQYPKLMRNEGFVSAMKQALREAAAQPAARWDSMLGPEREALANSLGLPPVIARNLPRAGWATLNPDLQARIAGAMAPVGAASEIDAAAHEASTSPKNDLAQPTEAQAKAGNYKKGHVSIGGLDVAIENPEGSTRSGIDPDGSPWSVTMSAHYGYVKRTTGADGDQVDVYIGKADPVQSPVFVVDQYDRKTGKFDEHKAILGASSLEEAQALYDAHFSDGKGEERRGAVTPMSFDAFKEWARNGNTKKPVSAAIAESTGTRGRAADAAEDLRAMAQDAGWAERGGLLIRDAAGNATGRTKWLPRAEWFMAGMEADPETLGRDIDRFAAGERVPAKSLRTIEGMLDWLDAQRGEPRLDEDASAYDFEAAGLDLDASEEALLIGDIFAEAAPQDEAAVMRALGFTEEEIQDVVEQKADREGPRGTGQDGAGRAQEAGEVARSDAQPQGEAGSESAPEGLTSYTNEDIARQEAAQRAAAAEAERTQREAEQKAQADAERDTFTLTGSDRPADVLAAQGQGGLFDAPAEAKPTNLKDGLAKIRKEKAAQAAAEPNQEPIKNEPRANAGPAAETAPADQEAVKNLAPGTRINGKVERAAADRLESLHAEMAVITNRNSREGNAKAAVRSVIEELRRERTVTSVVAVLEGASSALARNYGAFSDALDQVAESLGGQPQAKSSTDQPAVGNAPSPLEALFSDLNSDSTRKANKAKKAAAKLPQAARIDYVQANFHDILIQMMEAGALEVNGATTLTEDNAPCL